MLLIADKANVLKHTLYLKFNLNVRLKQQFKFHVHYFFISLIMKEFKCSTAF
jgi:hypothetical protein